jgi:hypothetical protein
MGKMNDKAKYIYLAGIIDGEGSLIVSRSDRGSYMNYYGRIHVKNTDYRLIKWLLDKFGGTVSNHEPSDPVKHKKAYSWYFSGDAHDKEVLLLSIMPYLIVKKEQAKILIEFFRMHDEKNPAKREDLYQKSLALNHRGPTVETITQIAELDSVKIESELTGDCESAEVILST